MILSAVPEYQIFCRVLEEQARINDQGVRIPKDKKEISADSVQNPFDATVTYRYKRGAASWSCAECSRGT